MIAMLSRLMSFRTSLCGTRVLSVVCSITALQVSNVISGRVTAEVDEGSLRFELMTGVLHRSSEEGEPSPLPPPWWQGTGVRPPEGLTRPILMAVASIGVPHSESVLEYAEALGELSCTSVGAKMATSAPSVRS